MTLTEIREKLIYVQAQIDAAYLILISPSERGCESILENAGDEIETLVNNLIKIE